VGRAVVHGEAVGDGQVAQDEGGTGKDLEGAVDAIGVDVGGAGVGALDGERVAGRGDVEVARGRRVLLLVVGVAERQLVEAGLELDGVVLAVAVGRDDRRPQAAGRPVRRPGEGSERRRYQTVLKRLDHHAPAYRRRPAGRVPAAAVRRRVT